MGEFIRPVVSITVLDGVKRDATTSYWITHAELLEYVTAADDAARAASDVGTLVAKHIAMQEGAFVKIQASLEVINDPVAVPAETVYRGNKLIFHGRAGGRGVSWTVPCRKVASYDQLSHDLDVAVNTNAAMIAYVNAVEGFATDMFGNDISIISCEISD